MSAQIKHPSTSEDTAANMAKSMILGQLYTNEVVSKPLLQAFADTHRELFVPANLHDSAYVDSDLDVGNGRSLLAPLTFGRLLNLADIQPAARVLDIGCLTGYSTAILAKLASHVVAIDTDADAIAKAKELLKGAQNVNLQVVKSLADGYGMSAPYDVIVIEGGIQFVPEVLARQLSDHGCIVSVFKKHQPLGLAQGIGKGMVIKHLDGMLQYREHFDAAADVLSGFEQSSGFSL